MIWVELAKSALGQKLTLLAGMNWPLLRGSSGHRCIQERHHGGFSDLASVRSSIIATLLAPPSILGTQLAFTSNLERRPCLRAMEV
jgi:hypothetical protein